jgi:hypothetical protein
MLVSNFLSLEVNTDAIMSQILFIGPIMFSKHILLMLSFLAFSCSSTLYPLLLDVPKDVSAPTPESLGVLGTLPENLTVFIITPWAEPPITELAQLSTWANSVQVSGRGGKIVTFSSVDSNKSNFLAAVRAIYPRELTIDVARECLCKIREFKGGLITFRVHDDARQKARGLVEGLPQTMAYAFIGERRDLFQT